MFVLVEIFQESVFQRKKFGVISYHNITGKAMDFCAFRLVNDINYN